MAAAGTSARSVYAPRPCVLGLIAPWDSPHRAGVRWLAGRPGSPEKGTPQVSCQLGPSEVHPDSTRVWVGKAGAPVGAAPAGLVICRVHAVVEISTVSAAAPEPDFWILNMLCYSIIRYVYSLYIIHIFTGEQRRHGGKAVTWSEASWQKRT